MDEQVNRSRLKERKKEQKSNKSESGLGSFLQRSGFKPFPVRTQRPYNVHNVGTMLYGR